MGGATRLVHCVVERGVATITLDSPANRNALSRQLIGDLHDALDTAEESRARVVVLTHVAPAFCSGADLSERAASNAATDSGPMVYALQRLSDIAAPTIAAVDGPVRAGGLGLMASCDLVVVRTDATFAFTEVRIGVAPAIISVPILRRCGWSKLAGPFLTGEVFDAATARDMGLVTHVTDDVAATVASLTDGVLRGAPGAVAATKRILRHPGDWEDMQYLSETLFRSAEAAEGMRAFAEKRTPSWVDGSGS
jgi:enoyl-CoA hydratase/carnithine racemase